MEPRFRHDFSQITVHTDARAVESAQVVNALAYTVGQNVVFNAGQYTPETITGKRLIAHELTHVVQQNSLQPLPTSDTSMYPKEPIAVQRAEVSDLPEEDVGDEEEKIED
jgi:Domain of unknown function (DUF4157)